MSGTRRKFDAANLRKVVAIADAGRDGEIRYIGEIDAEPCSTKRLIGKLATKDERLHFCYEAGPTGYGLHRLITSLGHSYTVAPPWLIPRTSSEGVRTGRCGRPRWRGDMSAPGTRRQQTAHRKALKSNERRLVPGSFPSAKSLALYGLRCRPCCRKTPGNARFLAKSC